MKKIKNKEIFELVKDLYLYNGYGYRKISKYLWEKKEIKVSWHTIKKWVKEMNLEIHEGKKFKEGGLYWYKKELKKAQEENMELKQALEELERLKLFEEEQVLLKNEVQELKDARAKDQQIINMLFETLHTEWKQGNIKSIREVVDKYEEISGIYNIHEDIKKGNVESSKEVVEPEHEEIPNIENFKPDELDTRIIKFLEENGPSSTRKIRKNIGSRPYKEFTEKLERMTRIGILNKKNAPIGKVPRKIWSRAD